MPADSERSRKKICKCRHAIFRHRYVSVFNFYGSCFRYAESGVTIAEVTQHFEQSLKHLASLDDEMILNFQESEQV